MQPGEGGESDGTVGLAGGGGARQAGLGGQLGGGQHMRLAVLAAAGAQLCSAEEATMQRKMRHHQQVFLD